MLVNALKFKVQQDRGFYFSLLEAANDNLTICSVHFVALMIATS